MCQCAILDNSYDGKKVEDIPELATIVDEVSTNFKTWETVYICRICGQKWLEKYISRGHGEVPITQKI